MKLLHKATSIVVNVTDGHFLDWMDKDLPIPTTAKEVNLYSAEYWNHKDSSTSYEITYAIDGYFGTHNGTAYLHDIASKIAYALNGTYTIGKTLSNSTYTLSRFNHLDKVPSYNAELESNAWNGSRNEIFHALRYKAYQMHRSNTLNLEALTIYGNNISNGSEHIKYLSKNVFRWVEENYTGRQSVMSRSQAGANASKIKSERIKSKIFSALKSPLFFNPDSISSGCNTLSVSWITFKKYLGEYQNLKTATMLIARVATPYVQLVLIGIEELREVAKNVILWSHTQPETDQIRAVHGTAPPYIHNPPKIYHH